MKLFNPQAANQFVFAVVAKNAREGTPPEYKCCGSDSIESCEAFIDAKALRNAYPYVMGRYDADGRYCTYTPPIEGVKPGRFVLHPMAEGERDTYERDLMYERHGRGVQP